MKADTSGKIEMCFAAIGLLAKVHVYEGQIGVAKESVQNFKEKAINEQASQLVPNIEALETKIALLQGKNDIAREWFEKAPNENISFCVLYRYQYMQKIRCLMAFRRYEEAIHLIERLNLYFTQYDRTYRWMENQTLKAIVQYQTGNKEWKITLNNVLRKMESYHFNRIAGMEGIALKPLLDDYQEPPVSENFFALLKKEVGKMAKHYPNYLRAEKKLKEPLTEMENQILNLLCEDQTTERICELYGISYGTLKFHNRNIYQKLGVKNRKEAEAAARELGLCNGE